MRQQDEQTHAEQPEAVASDPVPVPPPDNDAGTTRIEDSDRIDGAPTGDAPASGRGPLRSDREPDRPEFHEPAPAPTAFGASTVGGAVAAAALADEDPSREPDPRDESTVRPGDGRSGDDGTPA